MCDDFIIYPGNNLTTQIEATIQNEDGSTSELDLTIYDVINIHFQVTPSSDPLIELSTEEDGGLTIDGNKILIDKDIDSNVSHFGYVIYDIECINDSGITTYGPGEALIVKKITNQNETT